MSDCTYLIIVILVGLLILGTKQGFHGGGGGGGGGHGGGGGGSYGGGGSGGHGGGGYGGHGGTYNDLGYSGGGWFDYPWYYDLY